MNKEKAEIAATLRAQMCELSRNLTTYSKDSIIAILKASVEIDKYEYLDVISKIFKTPYDGLSLGDLYSRIDSYFAPKIDGEKKGKKQFEVYRHACKLKLMLTLDRKIKELEGVQHAIAGEGKLTEEMGTFLFDLGYFVGITRSFDPGLSPFSMYKDFFACVAGTEATKGRWNNHNQKLQPALDEADQKWEEGDESLHHEMATYLAGRYPEFSKEYLQDKLKPIAKKHSRLFGTKGTKKEKS